MCLCGCVPACVRVCACMCERACACGVHVVCMHACFVSAEIQKMVSDPMELELQTVAGCQVGAGTAREQEVLLTTEPFLEGSAIISSSSIFFPSSLTPIYFFAFLRQGFYE